MNAFQRLSIPFFLLGTFELLGAFLLGFLETTGLGGPRMGWILVETTIGLWIAGLLFAAIGSVVSKRLPYRVP